jgi:glycerol-3-phosphate dehydrogenase (NAD(P)+)
MSKRVVVLGAGAWGQVLAHLLKNNGHQVLLWSYKPFSENSIKVFQQAQIQTSESLEQVFQDVETLDCVVTAVPAQTYFDLYKILGKFNLVKVPMINTSKGIDVKTGLLLSELLHVSIPNFPMENYTLLSGPSFAEEVFRKMPTAVVAASISEDRAKECQMLFGNAWFRVYTNTDLLGVELAGAIKNVIAIASGICEGLGLGLNTRSALLIRGNTEIVRLGKTLGAKVETFYGLAGMGDLILTAMSSMSRNFSFGHSIGKGLDKKEAFLKIGGVVEGVETVKSVKKMAQKYQVEMPIVDVVYSTLFENMSPQVAVQNLMGRDLKSE